MLLHEERGKEMLLRLPVKAIHERLKVAPIAGINFLCATKIKKTKKDFKKMAGYVE